MLSIEEETALSNPTDKSKKENVRNAFVDKIFGNFIASKEDKE